MASRPLTGVDKTLALDGIEVDEQAALDDGPVYRVVGDSKIPVSKKMGTLWKSRKDQGLSARGAAQDRWDEAIKYYDNDQSAHRTSQSNSSGNTQYSQRLNSQYTETENVVFANAAIMVPMLYSKNPVISITTENARTEALAKVVQCLGNKLIDMKTAPGLSLKNKMRRTVLTAMLTNSAFVKINWIAKQDSSEKALQELADLTEQLQNAKTTKEIKKIEGRIAALEEKVNLLSPSGPVVRVLLPHHIVVDPTATEPDSSDANWMMEWDYLPTEYVNAVYGVDREGKVVSVYEPTHVLGCGDGNNGVQDEVDNFKLITEGSDGKPGAYGYETPEQLKAAQMTKVWWVWDKTTRRVYLYADNNWKWPIWVWDDPLNLPRFFPYFRLWFHESVNCQAPKGEVTYYLDQQDAINEINDETRRARHWAKRNIFYNKNAISQEDVEAVLKGPDGTARGVKLEEGMTLDKAIMSITPPALKFPELFDTNRKFEAINRITGLSNAMRGGEFRTNTTNQAVAAYQASSDLRTDDRIDLIEEFIADVMWNIMMLCMMNWSEEDVTNLLGYSDGWQQVLDPRQFDTMLSLRVESGTIGKPNSRNMQEQALKIGQIMGQFVQASPAVIVVLLKMYEKAFQGQVVISKEDWDSIIQTMQMQLQKAGAGPGGEQAQQEGNGTATTDEQLREQVSQQIAQLPPQAQQMLEQLVQQGVPPAEALKQVQEQVQQAQPK